MSSRDNRNPKPTTKVSHFVESIYSADSHDRTSERQDSVGKGTIDRSGLGKIYPTPKTYEQRQEQDRLRLEAYRHRLPRYPRLNIAILSSLVFGLSALFIRNFEQLWMSGQIWIIFLSFAGILLLFFLAMACIKYTSNIFYLFGGSMTEFGIIYVCAIILLLIIWLSGWLASPSVAFWLPLVCGLHFLVVFIILKLALDISSN